MNIEFHPLVSMRPLVSVQKPNHHICKALTLTIQPVQRHTWHEQAGLQGEWVTASYLLNIPRHTTASYPLHQASLWTLGHDRAPTADYAGEALGASIRGAARYF